MMGRPGRVAAGIAALFVVVAAPAARAQSPAQLLNFYETMPSVSNTVRTALASNLTIADFTAVAKLATSQTAACDMANFALGKLLPAGVPLPFDATCGFTADGAGYMVFGQNGPGLKPFAKFTTYVPTPDKGCSEREYNFTITMTGPVSLVGYAKTAVTTSISAAEAAAAAIRANPTANGVSNAALAGVKGFFGPGSDLDLYAAKHGATEAAKIWESWYNDVGDFAIIQVYNPYTRGTYLYMVASNTTKLGQLVAAATAPGALPSNYTNALAQARTIANSVASGATAGMIQSSGAAYGNPIIDHYAMSCYYPLTFFYIVGTGQVTIQ